VYVAGLALLAHHLIPEVVSAVRFLKAFVASTAVTLAAVFVGIVLFYAGRELPSENRFVGIYGNVPSGRYPRVIGTFLSPNLLCNFLICGLVAVLTARHLHVISRRVAAVLVAVAIIAIGFTLSSGIGGALLAAGIWLWAFPGDRSQNMRRAALVVGIAGAIAFVALTLVKLDLDNGLERSLRVRVWQDVGERFADSPLVGVGMDENLGHVVPENSTAEITDAHNLWLSVGGQMGLVGVVAIGAVLASPFVDRERRRALWRDPVGRGLTIALVGAVAYHGLSMSVEDARHLWVVLGALAGIAYAERETISVS
jgi:O-antigen ligase